MPRLFIEIIGVMSVLNMSSIAVGMGLEFSPGNVTQEGENINFDNKCR